MGDVNKKGRFFQNSVSDEAFLNLVKKIRDEVFEQSKILFSEQNLEKKLQAFRDLNRIENKYHARFKELDSKKRDELMRALQIDHRKIENLLSSISLTPYLDTEQGHIELVSKKTAKPFTLNEFLQDKNYLSNEMVLFEMNVDHFNPKELSKIFPGLENDEVALAIQDRSTDHKHLLFESNDIHYDIIKNGSHIRICGSCLLKSLNMQLKMDMPRSEPPGDINRELDKIIRKVA